MESLQRGGRKTRRLGYVLMLTLLLAVSCLTGYEWWTQTHTDHARATVTKAPSSATLTATGLTSKMLFMGDVFWSRYIDQYAQASPLKQAWPFSRLNEFDRASYDAWVADMECPVSNQPAISPEVEQATLTFNCSPSYLPEAAKWFTAMTLGNNHSGNEGQIGVDETRANLAKNGIQTFGAPDPSDYDNVCEVLAMPVKVQTSEHTTKSGKLPMAFCGYDGVFKTPNAQSMAVMQRYSKLMPVLAWPHSGTEYQPAPDQIKTSFYHALIDNGADAVIGDHPHWVQTSEAYKGHLIVYSVGNFIFDQLVDNETMRSAPIQMTISLERDTSGQLDKWLSLGDQCTAFHDTCLQRAEEQGLTKLPLQYQFSALGSSQIGKVTHPATADQLAAIKERLDWAQTIKGLAPPYSATP